MKQINVKSDFDFILRLKDCAGNPIGWPDYDWTAKFYTTSKVNAFVASSKDGVCANCYNDNGQIHVVCNSHHLGPGTLNVEFTAEIPNGIYPDDAERIVVPLPLEIELIRAAAPCPESFEVEVLLPYIKGEPFTYADFTPEQIAELQRPATEAAKRADEATGVAKQATVNAVEATEAANGAASSANREAANAKQEASAANATNMAAIAAEATREAIEATRISNEDARKSNEAERVTAENTRAQAEQARNDAEKLRREAETNRTNTETTRQSNENARVEAETARSEAESARKSAEGQRASAETLRKEHETARQTAEEERIEAERQRATEFAGFENTLNNKQDKLTTSEDLSLDANVLSLTDMTKKRLFIDLWNVACVATSPNTSRTVTVGQYNKATDLFELNGIADITYSSAIAIYNQYVNNGLLNCRTNLPQYGANINHHKLLGNNSLIESYWGNPIDYTVVDYAPNCGVREYRYIKITYFRPDQFQNNHKLTTLRDIKITANGTMYLLACNKLSLDSVYELINANPEGNCIMCHPDVYAKLTDEGNPEWHQALLDAVAKNVSFATV